MKKLYAIIAFCSLISYTTFSQTISSNAPLCGNANLTLELTATGGTTYAWKGPNNFTSTQQKPNIKNVNWKNRGVYTVTIDNKTTLTTDVNIKDPVAFTVPKEISVCEGGVLWINPQSVKLTDSTENASGAYTILNPNKNQIDEGIVRNFSAKDEGIYEVTSKYGLGCATTKYVEVKSNKSNSCKNIIIDDITKIAFCGGKDVVIPFTTKGNFPIGTKFKVYIYRQIFEDPFDRNQLPLTIVEKSPIILKNFQSKSFDERFRIIMYADDTEKTLGISNIRYSRNSFELVNNAINIKQSCDVAQLSFRYTNLLQTVQWKFNGNDIQKAQSIDATKSGNYSFSIGETASSYEADKTCLYESQPVKIELGKIPKPSVSVINDIELCLGKLSTLSVSSNANTNYRWKKDGNYIANATNSSYETLQEGKYQVEAKEGTCTAVSDTVVLKKTGRLEFNIEPVNSIRGGEEVNNTYQLCNNQGFDIEMTQLSPNTKLQFVRNGTVIKDTISNSIKGIKGSGSYFVKASYGTCSGVSNIINIKYDKFIYISSGDKYYNNQNICEGQVAFITFNSERLFNNRVDQVKYNLEKGKIYRNGETVQDWNFGFGYYYSNFSANQSGNYYGIGNIKLADGSICNLYSDTIKVNFTKKVQDLTYDYNEQLKAVSLTSCKDTIKIDTYFYYGAGQYGRETAYKWTKDGVVLKQDSSRVLQVAQSGTYQLETTYKGGCIVTSSPYKVEFGKIGVNFYGDLISPICEGSSKYLYPSLTENPDKSSYDFIKDGKTINTSLQNAYILTQPGIYKLKVTNGKCEGTSPDFTLKVDKIPTSITPSDSVTFCAGKTVELKTSTEAGLSYIWERNGSVISQANQANYTATTDGLYKATLLRGACWGTTPSVKLKTLANILPVATLTGDKKIDYDTETKLSINLTSHAPWTFKLSDGKEYTATKSPFEVSVKPLSTTTYSLSEVKNICGTGTVSGTAKIEIIILSAEEERELNVEVFPMPSSEICHWKIETPQATIVSVALYDASGITQYTHTSATRTSSHEGTIDLSTLKAGTYFLKLQAGEKSVTRKVVKF